MKKRISILAAAAAVLSSCGAASYTSSSGQRFEDGIYSRPRVEDTQKLMASKSETDELVQKTRSSEIYLSTDRTDGHRTDTLFIPEDKAAVINFSGTGTSVTVMDDPFEQVYFNTYPWTYYRPYTFSSFYWDPWYYGRYWGYYDPWYWGGWYRDPWFWGVGLAWDLWFYDPWFWGPAYPWYPHYCGWYGGWGPTYTEDTEGMCTSAAGSRQVQGCQDRPITAAGRLTAAGQCQTGQYPAPESQSAEEA